MTSENDRAAVDRPTRLSITSFKNDPGDDDDDVDYDHHNMMMTMMVSTFQAKKMAEKVLKWRQKNLATKMRKSGKLVLKRHF